METIARNADLGTLMTMLREQHVRKVDMVVPATKIVAADGILNVENAGVVMDEDGVTLYDGRYSPTSVALEGIADKLKIPIAYVRRMHADRPDLFDANVNGWLLGGDNDGPDPRSFLLRTFRGDNGPGIARAFLSDTYKVIDNIDVLMAVLDGIRLTGVEVRVDGGDLTERRMRVRVVCEEIQALAPTLLKGYRSPFTGATGDENPTVFAGFEVANSEVGGGAFSITPRLVVQVCNNGMTITKDALRNVHLGGRLEAGVVKWSDETQERNLALVKSQTRDAVATFLDVDYMTKVIERMEEKSTVEVASVDAVRDVTKPLGFTDDEIGDLLGHFIKGGQTTLGGVANAITAAAQEVSDGDRAAEFEAAAVAVLS